MVLPSKPGMGSFHNINYTICWEIRKEKLTSGWMFLKNKGVGSTTLIYLPGGSMEEILLQHNGVSAESSDMSLEFKDNMVRLKSGNLCMDFDWIQAENLFDELKRWMMYRDSPQGWSNYWSLAMK